MVIKMSNAILFYQINQKILRLHSRVQVFNSSIQGDKQMAICKKCNSADSNHEIKSPSKRYELKNGKKIEVCAGFSVIPDNFYKLDIQKIPQKVIAV